MPYELIEHITEEGDLFMIPAGWMPDEHSARCRSCGALICWLITPNEKRNPWSAKANASHFVDCPSSQQWRKK